MKKTDMLKFKQFEMLYESRLLESEFDAAAKDLAKEYSKDLSPLNSMLNEYMKAKKTAMEKRVKINADILKSTDAEEKSSLNDDLAAVNNDEDSQIERVEKKLADWSNEKAGVLRFLMRSRLKEIELEVLEDEYAKSKSTLTDSADKRMRDLIDNRKDEIKTRSEKLDKMIEDADFSKEDEDIKRSSEEYDKIESDYDGSGDVTAAEQKAMRQRKERRDKSPLNDI